jgi:hypothetical protein
VVAVRIYIEGGGDDNNTKGRLREGFVKFFGKLLATCDKPKVIVCGGRDAAFDQWQTAIKTHKDAFCILLVDSEAPVAVAMGPWSHLKKRDQWNKPKSATDDHCHLMVQCTEAWFIADPQALQQYYQQGFNLNALPRRTDVEAISKIDVYKALASATRNTKTKGEYGKGTHAADLLAEIDPQKVINASPHLAKMAKLLRTKLCPDAHLEQPAPKATVATTKPAASVAKRAVAAGQKKTTPQRKLRAPTTPPPSSKPKRTKRP